MEVAQKIIRLQKERGWSDYKLAKEANISQSSLATLYARNTPPKLEMLQCICNAFGITLAQFFAEKEEFMVITPEIKGMLQLWFWHNSCHTPH